MNTDNAGCNPSGSPSIDHATNRIYWSNAGSLSLSGFPGIPEEDCIYRHDQDASVSWANLDGSGSGVLNTTGATVSNISGTAIDPETNRIYWTNHDINLTTPGISWANLDGSGGGDLDNTDITFIHGVDGKISFTTCGERYFHDATVGVTRDPVLLKQPVGVGLPTVTQEGSQLSCSQGDWEADDHARHVMYAPREFAYAWQHDGEDIPGASGPTLSPAEPGDYRCRVTATNPAGSTTQTSTTVAYTP